jgi:hypothetical protein
VSTPLEAATENILSAIGKRDFEELKQTLRNRERLLETGTEVTLRAWELGENARLALADLKKELMLQSSRQEQILKIARTAPPRSGSGREYFG